MKLVMSAKNSTLAMKIRRGFLISASRLSADSTVQ